MAGREDDGALTAEDAHVLMVLAVRGINADPKQPPADVRERRAAAIRKLQRIVDGGRE